LPVKYKHNFQLSEHFYLNELIRSEKADELGVDNTPDLDSLYCLKALCTMTLEKVRELFGAPVIISSGYRCPQVNKAVGSKEISQHPKGQAADLHVEGHTVKEVFDAIQNSDVPYDQLIHEHQNMQEWVHISYDPDKTVQRHSAFKLIKT
jgi:zinc D-Ala-D-Ala carboxypeptidase